MAAMETLAKGQPAPPEKSSPQRRPVAHKESSVFKRVADRMTLPVFILAALFLALNAFGSKDRGHGHKKPNFIFIMTDDQDLHLNSLDYQPVVQKQFVQKGTWFKKHFCTVALCCPSRVSLLTGRAAHNTNVTDVSAVSALSHHLWVKADLYLFAAIWY